MQERTKQIIEENMERLNGKLFTPNEVKGITFTTFQKHVSVEEVTIETETILSLEEVTKMLNSGDACAWWNMDKWSTQVTFEVINNNIVEKHKTLRLKIK